MDLQMTNYHTLYNVMNNQNQGLSACMWHRQFTKLKVDTQHENQRGQSIRCLSTFKCIISLQAFYMAKSSPIK